MKRRALFLLPVSLLAVVGYTLFAQPPRGEPANTEPTTASIQWFATLASARTEAEKTGRPMLLISGTPHCAGVSGMW